MSSQPPKIFISYAHEDSPYQEKLVLHLKGLIQRGVISSWHDGLLVAGQEWNREIVGHLDTSRVVLLLVSSYFIASDYINNTELKRAAERYTTKEVSIIPILVRNVHGWQEKPFGAHKLGDFQALPDGLEFIVDWKNKDAAFANVVEGIEETIKSLKPIFVAARSASIPRPPSFGFVARRDAEGRDIVERLKVELAPGKNQLVTLSGPGGIGKTTLAAQAARASREVFAGRIVWSSADGRADLTLSALLDDIATQLERADIRTLAPDAKAEAVRALVADLPALVVLDNYETISSAGQRSIEQWFTLAQCCVLFTSRPRINQTLNIRVEAMSWEEAQEFLEKLIEQTQDQQIFSDEVRQRIYKTAEANPFVMQWVVAQIDAAQEPDTVLEELKHGEGDAAQRVFDRSFNLPQLGDDGRATLLALSLFVPSAARPALAAVAGFGDNQKRLNEAVKNLHALWLIKGLDANRRFTIEGLTRSLAAARLAKDERAEEFRQRFVAHFLNYAEAHAEPTPEDYDALEAEKDNLLSVTDVAFARKDWASVMQMAYAVANPVEGMLSVRGYWDDALRRGEQAMAAAREANNEWAVAQFTGNTAIIRTLRGEYDETKQAHQEALSTFRKIGSDANIAVGLHQLGRLAQDQGEIEEAQRLYNESLEINKKLGDQSGIAITLYELGRLAQAQGELEVSRQLYNESLEINEKLDNQRGIALTIHGLAILARVQGDLAEARQLYSKSLDIAKKLGDKSNLALISHNMGLLSEVEGDKAEAARLFREALSMFEKLGSPYAEKARRNLERLEGESS